MTELYTLYCNTLDTTLTLCSNYSDINIECINNIAQFIFQPSNQPNTTPQHVHYTTDDITELEHKFELYTLYTLCHRGGVSIQSGQLYTYMHGILHSVCKYYNGMTVEECNELCHSIQHNTNDAIQQINELIKIIQSQLQLIHSQLDVYPAQHDVEHETQPDVDCHKIRSKTSSAERLSTRTHGTRSSARLAAAR